MTASRLRPPGVRVESGAMGRVVLGIVLAAALVGTASAQPTHHGDLRVVRAGKGKLDLSSGQATFAFRGWELVPSSDSDGINPATEPISIGVAEERFLIPAGQLRVSKNGKRFRYSAPTARGVEKLLLVKLPTGAYRVTLKLSGVDLSTLLAQEPPVCLSFAVIIGNDDGFTGVSFDRPKPYPSKLLTLPGFCTSNTSWPWA